MAAFASGGIRNIQWYGISSGKAARGILRRRPPYSGLSRDVTEVCTFPGAEKLLGLIFY